MYGNVWHFVVKRNTSDCVCGWEHILLMQGSLHATWKWDHVRGGVGYSADGIFSICCNVYIWICVTLKRLKAAFKKKIIVKLKCVCKAMREMVEVIDSFYHIEFLWLLLGLHFPHTPLLPVTRMLMDVRPACPSPLLIVKREKNNKGTDTITFYLISGDESLYSTLFLQQTVLMWHLSMFTLQQKWKTFQLYKWLNQEVKWIKLIQKYKINKWYFKSCKNLSLPLHLSDTVTPTRHR